MYASTLVSYPSNYNHTWGSITAGPGDEVIVIQNAPFNRLYFIAVYGFGDGNNHYNIQASSDSQAE